MKFHLETERLILREFQETDIDGIFELDSNPEVHKYLGNKPITTKDQALNYIQFIIQQYNDHGIGRFVALEKATGDFIGWSGLKLNYGEKEALNGLQAETDNLASNHILKKIGLRFVNDFLWEEVPCKWYALEKNAYEKQNV